MEVIRAEAMGMCFGVRDALVSAAGVPDPSAVTIHGELVHNEEVLGSLHARGFRMSPENDRATVPETPFVLITAHGISDRERVRLERHGKRLIDTTCPLVTRVHEAAERFQRDGFHVILIGRRGHVEVEGIVGDLESYDVVESADDVRAYSSRRLGLIAQSTAASEDVERIRAAIETRNPDAEICFVDTVCQPTKDRQRAIQTLLERVDLVVVVGGSNSNNTAKLVARCRESVPAYLVQRARDLRPEWFDGCLRVGLTAGTSTLSSTIDEVHRALLRIGAETDKARAS